MAMILTDPCAHCSARHSDVFRKVCQGTPFCPGICPSAKDHWAAIGYMSTSNTINDSHGKRLHREHLSGRPR